MIAIRAFILLSSGSSGSLSGWSTGIFTQGGNEQTFIGNGRVSYKDDKYSFAFSTNYQRRDRFDDLYYEYLLKLFLEVEI